MQKGRLPREVPKDLVSETQTLNAFQAAALYGISIATWRRMVMAGQTPPPILVGRRRQVWFVSDLLKDLKQRRALPHVYKKSITCA